MSVRMGTIWCCERNAKFSFNQLTEKQVNQCMLTASVNHRGVMVDSTIGQVDIPIRDGFDGAVHGPSWYHLQSNGKVSGELRLQFQLSGGNIQVQANGARTQVVPAGTTLTNPARTAGVIVEDDDDDLL